MKMTFRWYGSQSDPIPLKYIKQIPGMTGLMGLLDKPAGVDWPEEEFAALKKEVNEAGLDILVDVDRFDDLDFQPGVVDLLLQGGELLLRPVHAGGLVQQAHEAGHARYLFHVFQRDGIDLAAVPAECHFHNGLSSSL